MLFSHREDPTRDSEGGGYSSSLEKGVIWRWARGWDLLCKEMVTYERLEHRELE